MLKICATICSFFVFAAVSFKVLDFKRSYDNIERDGISTATPDSSFPLPPSFIVCTSHYQKRINASSNSIFVLYEDEHFENRWFTIGLWEDAFWIEFNNASWIPFHRTPLLELRTWMNVCVEFNIKTKLFKLSVNGEKIQEGTTTYNFRESYNLHLELGKTENSWAKPKIFQFVGMVRSVHIFTTKVLNNNSLEDLSKEPENYTKHSDLLTWDDTKWNLNGSNVQWITMKDEFLYSDVIKIPQPVSFHEAMRGCSILGGIVSDTTELKNVTKLDQMVSEPFGFWIPYTDESKESEFVNIYTGKQLGSDNFC